jgi:hypothetical protein
MTSKEIWFVRHTETETPESYDFDLSQKGKRNARLLGWHLAQQEFASPVIILHLNTQRANTMADALGFHMKGKPGAKVRSGLLPPSTAGREREKTFGVLFAITNRLDQLADQFGGNAPNTAIFIIHRQQAWSFDLFRFMLDAEKSDVLRDATDRQLDMIIDDTARDFGTNYHAQYRHGELYKMRFPVSSWSDVDIGTGKTIERATPDMIRPHYKAWCRDRQALRLQQPSQ